MICYSFWLLGNSRNELFGCNISPHFYVPAELDKATAIDKVNRDLSEALFNSLILSSRSQSEQILLFRL